MSAIPKPLPETRAGLAFHRFTLGQYHRMIEAGILNEDDRVELLEGWIVTKVTHNPPHDASVSFVDEALTKRISANWILRIQSAITTGDSEPEPDVTVARGPTRRYVQAHPKGKDIALLVEVADTTVQEDRETKGRVYARARIPAYWLVNLRERQVEVFTDPRGGRSPVYRHCRIYGVEESVPLVIEGRIIGHIPVRELLP